MTTTEPPLPTDRDGRPLAGPCDLHQALALAEPSTAGLRFAVSSPEGTYMAVQFSSGRVEVRRLCEMSGQAGSQMNTGAWVAAETVARLAWRPG